MNGRVVKLYVVEDDPIILESYKYFIDANPRYSLCGFSTSAEEAFEAIQYVYPDILLLDIYLPGIDGVSAIPKLKAIRPDTNILMLTVNEDSDLVFKALKHGAVGYLLKGSSMQSVFSGIEEVLKGGAPISPSIARYIIDVFKVENIPVLSERELEVLNKLSDGSNNSQIAKELYVSTNTIKAHVKNIYKKLHVHSRAEAVKKGFLKGLIK